MNINFDLFNISKINDMIALSKNNETTILNNNFQAIYKIVHD